MIEVIINNVKIPLNITILTKDILSFKFFYKLLIYLIINILLINKLFANFTIIRDAETENFLRNITYPIFNIAQLDTKNLKIYIVNDNSINAFVSGGQNIFINSGLITKFNDPSVIAGVIAHEVGHIASSHIAKSYENYNSNLNNTIVGYGLGIGAILLGNSDAGTAIILSSLNLTNRLSMKYSRSQEESADILALQYLEKLKLPVTGLIEIMKYFNQQNIDLKNIINEYDLTHPLSNNRLKLIENFNNKYKYKNNKFDKKIFYQLQRSQAKLIGFSNDLILNLDFYKNRNDDASKIIYLISLFRNHQYKNSLKILDNLILKYPNDGFLLDLKAEFLFSQNNIIESILYYKKAINNLDNQSKTLSQIGYANAIAEMRTNDIFLLNSAIQNLLFAKIIENENPLLFKILANLYNQINQKSYYYLYLAEYNYLLGDLDKAKKNIQNSIDEFKKCKKNDKIINYNDLGKCDSKDEIRANDLLLIIEKNLNK
jgi:predicted Zn-dependent protease